MLTKLKTVMKFVLVVTLGFWAAEALSVVLNFDPDLTSAPLYLCVLEASLPFGAAVVVEAVIQYVVCLLLRKGVGGGDAEK